MKHFYLSIGVTLFALAGAGCWGWYAGFGGHTGLSGALGALFIAAILGAMEISLSFDNAVVNASTLRDFDERWRRRFLTWGMLIAVFGMRLVFPIVIVAVAAMLPISQVLMMALQQPGQYADHLHTAHPVIASFGGVFLLMVFLNFVFDEGKEVHWLRPLEEKLALMGKLDSASIVVTLAVLVGLQSYLPEPQRLPVLVAGVSGVLLYSLVDGLGNLLSPEGADSVKRTGLMGFLYLEFLDASFSFDGVIGAFAITREVVIIMLGLAIGAMFVRSMTIFLVERGTLDEFIFLEHGAHYAVGVLAVIMLVGVIPHWQTPEVITGLIGVGFILTALWSSFRHRKLEASLIAAEPEPEATLAA